MPHVFYTGAKLPIPSLAPTTVGTTLVLLPVAVVAPSLIGPIGGAGCLLHPTIHAAAVKIPGAAPLHPSIPIPAIMITFLVPPVPP